MMPQEVLIGKDERFQVIWKWLQPQEEVFILMDTQTNERLMTLNSTNNTQEMYRICELLNELTRVKAVD